LGTTKKQQIILAREHVITPGPVGLFLLYLLTCGFFPEGFRIFCEGKRSKMLQETTK